MSDDDTTGEAHVADANHPVADDLNDQALYRTVDPDPSDAGDLNDANLRGDGEPTPPEVQDHAGVEQR